MTKKIYLTRHGETDFNKRGVVQGSGIDADLNALGRKQAEAFYQAYKNHPFDKLYVSGLKRTSQSMAQFIASGMAFEALEELNEISWGNREGQAFNAANDRYYFEMINKWRNGQTDFAIDGGESPEQVAMRLSRGLQKIMAREEEKEVLVCMHGRALRILLTLMLNYPLSAMDLFEHQNLCLYELEYAGSFFKLNRFNATDHLTHLAG